MHLLTSTTLAKAEIYDHIRHLHGELTGAACRLNAMLGVILPLPDSDLAELANDMGPQLLEHLSTLHMVQGGAVNTAAQTVVALLGSCGLTVPAQLVDIRPLAVKLAEQGRSLDFDMSTGAFSVSRQTVQAPEPTPEPEPTRPPTE